MTVYDPAELLRRLKALDAETQHEILNLLDQLLSIAERAAPAAEDPA